MVHALLTPCRLNGWEGTMERGVDQSGDPRLLVVSCCGDNSWERALSCWLLRPHSPGNPRLGGRRPPHTAFSRMVRYGSGSFCSCEMKINSLGRKVLGIAPDDAVLLFQIVVVCLGEGGGGRGLVMSDSGCRNSVIWPHLFRGPGFCPRPVNQDRPQSLAVRQWLGLVLLFCTANGSDGWSCRYCCEIEGVDDTHSSRERLGPTTE
jgi:hypothetical protein